MSAVLVAARLATATEPTSLPATPVVAPGEEKVLAEMLGLGATLPGPCAFTGGEVNGAVITGRYRCADGDVVVTLRPPSPMAHAVSHTEKFVVTTTGSTPPRFLEELESRIRSRESSFQWSQLKRDRDTEQHLTDEEPSATIDWLTACLILTPLVLALLIALWRDRARREEGPFAARVGRRCLAVLFSLGAVALLSEAAYRTILYFDTPRPAAGDFEIYGVGDSTLVGEPFEPKISVLRILEYLFAGDIAGRRIVLKNLAERGAPLYPQSIAFEQAVAARDRHVPGVVLIMSGHNESIPPQFAVAQPHYLPSLISQKSAIVRDLLLTLRRRRLLGRERSLAAYEFYLRQVLDTATKSGLTPILATMASNISRIEPNADSSDGEALAGVIQQGLRFEGQGQYADARDLYVNHISQDRRAAASLYYRAGRCEEALGHFTAAREDYWNAVDRDPRVMFGRTTRPQNELIRQLAREYGVPLVDSVAILEAHAPNGILGDELFMDGQHPTIEGYLLLARAYAEILNRQFKAPIVHPLSDARDVTAALGFEAKDLPAAIVDSGSWLIATSVGHPFPNDRMALAEKRFRSLLGRGDDFSAWVGIALSQAALRGGLLRDPTDVNALGHWLGYVRSYEQISAADLSPLVSRFRASGVDDVVVDHIRRSAAGPTPARDRR